MGQIIVGIDEAGRGPLAGPLIAAAVSAPIDFMIDGLTDSKKLSRKNRLALFSSIKLHANCISIGWATNNEVDRYGLTSATKSAMERAWQRLNIVTARIIIDGSYNYLKHITNTQAVVKADLLIPVVSAASIIAKVYRDAYMRQMSKIYPLYGFEEHVGYGTGLHLRMLSQYGGCKLHRVTFRPLSNN